MLNFQVYFTILAKFMVFHTQSGFKVNTCCMQECNFTLGQFHVKLSLTLQCKFCFGEMDKKKGFATQNPLIVADKNVVLTTLLFCETNLLFLYVIECCMSVCFFPILKTLLLNIC